MEAIITSFRRSRHHVHSYQMIIEPLQEVDLEKLIGKQVIYNTGKKKITGIITAKHGSKRLRVRFETGMPGQALGKRVVIKE